MPRSYRPITLEECLGKVLEKIVAKRLQYFSNTLGLLPSNQFGGRERASVLDAGAALIENIQSAWAKGKVYSVLACDVQGFFDNVGHQHLSHTMRQLGLPVPIQGWVSSFVAERSVAISFDGFCGPLALKPNHGVPQGSPVSPILAELFASSALTSLQGTSTQLLAYVDDHLLGAEGDSVVSNADQLQTAYNTLSTHLATMGLSLDSAKTECMHFTRNTRNPAHRTDLPIVLTNALGPGRDFTVVPSKPLRVSSCEATGI